MSEMSPSSYLALGIDECIRAAEQVNAGADIRIGAMFMLATHFSEVQELRDRWQNQYHEQCYILQIAHPKYEFMIPLVTAELGAIVAIVHYGKRKPRS